MLSNSSKMSRAVKRVQCTTVVHCKPYIWLGKSKVLLININTLQSV